MAAMETKKQIFVQQDSDAGGSIITAVAQCEEDVRLDAVSDEESAPGRVREHGVGLLHGERPPVEAAVLELLVGLLHQSVLL